MLRTVIFVLREEPDRENLYLNRTLKEREQQAIAISVGEANERTPNVLVIFLRSLIASHVKKLKKPLDVNEELLLLTNVTDFIGAYHQIMKLINSPFPFPLVQMTRTLLFIWLFSLPFALVNTMTTLLAPVIIMFFLTFGFQGLEFLSIIMDDPFGKDPLAFDVMTMGDIVYGDIYISLHDVDGQRVKERLEAVTSSTLSKGIKEEVHGHARSFSRMQSWIAVEKSGTSLGSKTESDKGGEQGSISEKGVFFKTFSNDMQLSTISNSTIDSVDNAVIGKISYGSIGSSSFDHDREKKKIAKNSEGSMDVFDSSKSFKDEIIGSRYFEKDRNNRKVEFP